MSEPTDEKLRDLRAELSDEEFDDLRFLYLSRVMFNPMVGWPAETLTLDEFIDAALARRLEELT